MIYLDHASTTYIYPELVDMICSQLHTCWGNPSSLYDFGVKNKEAIEFCRTMIADCVGAAPEEIFFTSGSSEGNAWALKQSSMTLCSPYEHHNIISNPCSRIIDVDYLKRSISYQNDDILGQLLFKDKLGSWMYVNNETGEIFDLDNISALMKKLGLNIHSDMTQALGNVPINLHKMNIDIATFSGHKVHAPKGVGFIYFNKNTFPVDKIVPLIYGGGQEKGIRAGTENFPYITALAHAVKRATGELEKKQNYCKTLKLAFLEELSKDFDSNNWMIVSPSNSINSTVTVCFKGIDGEILMACLNDDLVYVGTGSACNSGDMEPSTVLSEMGIPEDYIRGEIRISLDLTNTVEEVVYCAQKLKKYYKDLTDGV